MSVEYTNPCRISSMLCDLKPPRNQSRTGYGSKMATAWRIRYGVRWHRVYVMNYGNAGSAYIQYQGRDLFIDVATEYSLKEGLSHPCLKAP